MQNGISAMGYVWVVCLPVIATVPGGLIWCADVASVGRRGGVITGEANC